MTRLEQFRAEAVQAHIRRGGDFNMPTPPSRDPSGARVVVSFAAVLLVVLGVLLAVAGALS